MRTPPDVSFYRARIAWVLGVSGYCAMGACAPTSTTTGFLVAPMASAPVRADAAAEGDAGTEGGVMSYRPLPDAPRGSQDDCDVTCTPELDEAPVWSYPPPFEKCGTTPNARSGEGSFSPSDTLDRRKTERDACCYVDADCGSSRGGRGRRRVPRP